MRDRIFESIERTCSSPAISTDWAAPERDVIRGKDDGHGRLDVFRKLKDVVRARRRKAQTQGEHQACEIVLYFLRWYESGNCPIRHLGGTHTHLVLNDMATWCERKSGKIDPHAQEVLRMAMHEVHRTEIRGAR